MSKRDEFIAVINTFKAASSAITEEQRKGLLRQARQQYGLSFEEARQILKDSGLVVGDVVNYFEVLGLSINTLQDETEAAITTRVDAAHQDLYGASLRAGGLPRPDGKTQEQWRTLLNQARDTLKDPQQRREHIATLQPDGEATGTPSERTARPIFKFPNGDEATNISELAALMEKHPQEAAVALYRGYLEQSLGGAGEMHLAEAARTIVSTYSKTPEFGLWAMVQILRGKVKLSRGGEASTPQQLARLIDQNWEEAKMLLYVGFLPLWLEYTKQSRLANTAMGIIERSGDEMDVGLEWLVQSLDPQIGQPVSQVSHTSINFGKVDKGAQKTVRVEIQNTGRGYLYGDVQLSKAMPGLRISSTSIRGNAVLTVTLDTSLLADDKMHDTALVIKTNGGELRVPISLVLVAVKAPSTCSTQSPATQSPKEKSTAKTRTVVWVWGAVICGIILLMAVRVKLEQRNLDGSVGGAQTSSPTVSRADVPFGMVLIPAGEFQMGSNDSEASNDEQPVHTVYVDAFYMDEYEVTNARYKAFIDANPQWQQDNIPDKYRDRNYLRHWSGNSYPSGKGNHPVVYVSWYAAMAYAQWTGKRLPTEAEWEKAARGGLAGKKYPWGDIIDINKANYGSNVGSTTPVGNYAPNGYGLYDMAGNVWEWCVDAYERDFYARSARQNPIAGKGVGKDFARVQTYPSRVLRGGSWFLDTQNLPVADRYRNTPTLTIDTVGFRCAMDITP